jgi:hypothetical protein
MNKSGIRNGTLAQDPPPFFLPANPFPILSPRCELSNLATWGRKKAKPKRHTGGAGGRGHEMGRWSMEEWEEAGMHGSSSLFKSRSLIHRWSSSTYTLCSHLDTDAKQKLPTRLHPSDIKRTRCDSSCNICRCGNSPSESRFRGPLKIKT